MIESFPPLFRVFLKGGSVDDSVAIDAKRILLRYGAPISILDNVSEADRIELAREVSRTALPERESRLRRLLREAGHQVALTKKEMASLRQSQAT
jgi:hypothetical protein